MSVVAAIQAKCLASLAMLVDLGVQVCHELQLRLYNSRSKTLWLGLLSRKGALLVSNSCLSHLASSAHFAVLSMMAVMAMAVWTSWSAVMRVAISSPPLNSGHLKRTMFAPDMYGETGCRRLVSSDHFLGLRRVSGSLPCTSLSPFIIFTLPRFPRPGTDDGSL